MNGCKIFPIGMENRKTRESSVARMRLEAGPESEIRAASLLGLRKLKGSNWTGLPQPKETNNNMMVPSGSRWAIGLSVNLPISLGVGSPSLSAINAWENSWMVMAVSNATI